MQKIALLTGAVVMALGMGAASTSAFAMGCLTNQNKMPTPSLSDNLMAISGGTASALPAPYDVGRYNALVAKGNACPTTEQSLPLDQRSSYRGSVYTNQR